jgi:hypothetical protein
MICVVRSACSVPYKEDEWGQDPPELIPCLQSLSKKSWRTASLAEIKKRCKSLYALIQQERSDLFQINDGHSLAAFGTFTHPESKD